MLRKRFTFDLGFSSFPCHTRSCAGWGKTRGLRRIIDVTTRERYLQIPSTKLGSIVPLFSTIPSSLPSTFRIPPQRPLAPGRYPSTPTSHARPLSLQAAKVFHSSSIITRRSLHVAATPLPSKHITIDQHHSSPLVKPGYLAARRMVAEEASPKKKLCREKSAGGLCRNSPCCGRSVLPSRS